MKTILFLPILAVAYSCGAVDKSNQPAFLPPANSVNNTAESTPTALSEAIVQLPTLHPPTRLAVGRLNDKAKVLPQPVYPAAARAVKASGKVAVQILIDKEGKVVSATAISGHPLLRSAAVQAARKAEFPPTIMSGQPVTVAGVLTYTFQP